MYLCSDDGRWRNWRNYLRVKWEWRIWCFEWNRRESDGKAHNHELMMVEVNSETQRGREPEQIEQKRIWYNDRRCVATERWRQYAIRTVTEEAGQSRNSGYFSVMVRWFTFLLFVFIHGSLSGWSYIWYSDLVRRKGKGHRQACCLSICAQQLAIGCLHLL